MNSIKTQRIQAHLKKQQNIQSLKWDIFSKNTKSGILTTIINNKIPIPNNDLATKKSLSNDRMKIRDLSTENKQNISLLNNGGEFKKTTKHIQASKTLNLFNIENNIQSARTLRNNSSQQKTSFSPANRSILDLNKSIDKFGVKKIANKKNFQNSTENPKCIDTSYQKPNITSTTTTTTTINEQYNKNVNDSLNNTLNKTPRSNRILEVNIVQINQDKYNQQNYFKNIPKKKQLGIDQFIDLSRPNTFNGILTPNTQRKITNNEILRSRTPATEQHKKSFSNKSLNQNMEITSNKFSKDKNINQNVIINKTTKQSNLIVNNQNIKSLDIKLTKNLTNNKIKNSDKMQNDNQINDSDLRTTESIQDNLSQNHLRQTKNDLENTSAYVLNKLEKAIKNQCNINLEEQKNSLVQKQKFRLNLEHIIEIEEILFNILNSLKSGQGMLHYCRDYINLVTKENLEGVDKLFKNQKTRRLLRGAIILERMTIVLIIYGIYYKKPFEAHISGLKDLIAASHRNFMSLTDIILERMPQSQKNNVIIQYEYLGWYKKLTLILETRLGGEQLSREQNIKILTDNLDQMIKTITVSFQAEEEELFANCRQITQQLFERSIEDTYKMLMESLSKCIIDDENDSQQSDTTVAQTIRPDGLDYQEAPYLPSLPAQVKNRIYTLALDLDETLVHYEEVPGGGGKFLIRPYTLEFLEQMSKYYEIVIFTAAMQEYADWVLNNLDKNNFISFRLYRQHATPNGASYIKDLSKLGRNLSRIIIVDNIPENFQLQTENGIFIKSWFDDPNDTALRELAPLLIEIVSKQVSDVRVALRTFRQQMIKNINNGQDQPHLDLKLD